MVLKIVKRETANGTAIIELTGRISLGRDSNQIVPEVTATLQTGVKVVIMDLTGISHVDSTGIGIMAFCFGKATQAGAQLRIAGARDNVLDVFRITRLDRVVPFFPDVESALIGNGRLGA